jgi:hypothetical protein
MLGSDIIVFEPNESTFAPLFSMAETCCRKKQLSKLRADCRAMVPLHRWSDIGVCSAIFLAEPTRVSTRRTCCGQLRTQR